jgi:DNA-directed RNA polymerase specialized sigma subunit
MRKTNELMTAQASEARLAARAKIDKLRARTEYLEGADRALMEMYFENGCSFAQMSRVIGASEAAIARRVQAICARLNADEYIAAVEFGLGGLDKQQQKLVREYFLQGKSIRDIATSRRVSYYRIRSALRRIENMVARASGK